MSIDHIRDAASYFSILRGCASHVEWNQVDSIADILCRAYEADKTTFLFGNGGSASLASHFACDLSKGTWMRQDGEKRFRATALTDNLPVLTAWANDSSYDDVFAEQLRGVVRRGDIVFAISCSGNSVNVLRALEVARAVGAITVGLSGFEGGLMKRVCDNLLIVPSDNMQIIEDLHLSIAHCLFTLVRNRIADLKLKKAISVQAS